MGTPFDDNNLIQGQQDPSQVADDSANPQTGSTDNGMISVGSPEAPMVADVSESVKPTEYGYEVLKKLESGQEAALEAAEKKEDKRPDDPAQQQQVIRKEEKKESLPASPQTPKYFGYNIPPQIANNFSLIKKNKGKGDPNASKTWVYVLLDRLLKMRESN